MLQSFNTPIEPGFQLLKWLPAEMRTALLEGNFVEKTQLHSELSCFLEILEAINENRFIVASDLIDQAIERSEFAAELFLLNAWTNALMGNHPKVLDCVQKAHSSGYKDIELFIKNDELLSSIILDSPKASYSELSGSENNFTNEGCQHEPNNDSSNINFGPNSLKVDSSLPFAFQGKGYSNTPDSEGLIGVCFCTSIKDRLWQIQQTLPVNISNLKNTNHRIAIADYGSSDGLEEWLTSSGILSSPNIIYQKFNVGEFGWSSPVAKNLASSLAPLGYGIFNLDADNFITSSDIKQIFDALNNDQVVHQFSGEWGDGSFGRIGLPPQWFNRLSGYEERLLPMGYQDADILNRAEKLGLEVATIGAPETKAIQNDVETKFAFCSNVDGAKMNYANRVVAECLMASGSLEAGNHISRTILNQNKCLSDESPYDGAHIANASILSKYRTNAIDVGHQLHHSKLKHDFSIGFIRRNIHRLEKSFCFDPWKPNAGEDFLLLLVEQLRSWPKDQLTSELYCSGYIALKKYFDNPLNNALWVEKSRAVFSELSSPDFYQKAAVFSFCETKNDVISEEDMARACEALFDRRVSVRDYKPESISPDIIKKCVDMALSAPSACNRQPFNFLLLANAEKRNEVLKLAPGSKGWANKAPYVAAFVADYSSFEQKYDHGLAMIDASLFSAYLQIAFSSHGIGSCCLNWPDKDQLHSPVGNILGLDSHQTVVMLMAFGYPTDSGLIPRSIKKKSEEIIKVVV